MSVIDIEHAINILIVTDGNSLVIEHARPSRNGESINDCGYGLTSVHAIVRDRTHQPTKKSLLELSSHDTLLA